MSLFKVRDWWSTTCGHDERFDVGCLCVANIDNNPNGFDKVLTGSFEGILRLFGPQLNRQEDGNLIGFKPDDLLLETQLTQPILQMKTGRLSGVTEKISLAVLHPRKVAVFGISVISGAVEHGTHYHLSLVYEHNLKRSAFSMVLGPFGAVRGQDFICVQSLDGTLSFFEQESFAFSRFLPGFLLPGPLNYVQRTDSFVTVSSSWQLECYKYQVLAVATDTNSKEESQSLRTGKKVMVDWKVTLGEAALDIEVVSSKSLIFVLGERHWFCFHDYGTLSCMKRLDYHPSCFYSYLAPIQDSPPFLLVASHSQSIYVYQESNLKWAAQIPFLPVAVRKATFQDLQGILVMISETGQLACSYMGTAPAIFVPPSVESREVNYTESDAEMNELQRTIKATQKSSNFVPAVKAGTDLKITVNVANVAAVVTEPNAQEEDENAPAPTVSIRIQLQSVSSLQNVQLKIQIAKPFLVTQSVFTFQSIKDSVQVMISVHTNGTCLPSSLTAQAIATFLTKGGIPQIVTQTFKMPINLILKPCLPVKEAKHKITINTNRPAINLAYLFPGN